MSKQTPDMDEETDEKTEERYASLEIGDGDVVIYDREEPSAWLQSDYIVEPAA